MTELNVFSEAVTEKFRQLDRENIALKAKLDVVLTLIGKSDKLSSLKSADVVELPRFIGRDHAA